jgi:hypothetical protein
MNANPTLHWPPSPNNVFFCLPNMSKSIKHKILDCIQAKRVWRWAMFIMHKLCGARTGNYDSFNWKQALFGEKNSKEFNKKIGTFYMVLCFGPFKLNATTKCSTMNNGMNLRANIISRMNSSFTPRRHGNT